MERPGRGEAETVEWGTIAKSEDRRVEERGVERKQFRQQLPVHLKRARDSYRNNVGGVGVVAVHGSGHRTADQDLGDVERHKGKSCSTIKYSNQFPPRRVQALFRLLRGHVRVRSRCEDSERGFDARSTRNFRRWEEHDF